MITARSRTSRTWLPCLVNALALARCSTPAQTQGPTTPQTGRTTSGSSAAAQAVDLSPVPPPEGLLAVVRIPAPRGLARELGQRLGLGAFLVQGMEGALPATVGDDEALARAIDLDAPMDVVVAEGTHDPRVIVAFGALSMPRVEDALAQGHRLTPVEPSGSGVRRIRLMRDNEPVEDASIHCVLAPVASVTHDGARIVCAERYEHLGPFVAYATRTLPATPVPPEEASLVAELMVDSLRNSLRDDVDSLNRDMDREAASARPDPNNPQFQDAMRSWLRETLSPSLAQGLNDLASARASLKLTDQGAQFSLDVGLRTTTAPLLQQAVAATRDVRLTQQLLAPLPQNGTSYGAAGVTVEPLRPTVNLLVSVVARMLLPNTRVPPAEATALRTALASVFASNRITSAATGAQDAQRRAWGVSTYQTDLPASQYVANVRTLFNTLRRPAIARAIRADLRVDPMTFRVAPAAGMPAGSLLVQLPAAPAAARNARNAPAATAGSDTENPLTFLRRMLNASDAAFELLLVPEGNTVWAATGSDARARYREARANHPPPPEVPGLQDEGVVAAAAFLPIGLAHSLGRFDETMGRNLERMIAQSPAAGTTPITVRVLSVSRNGVHHLAGEALVPNSTLGMVGRGLNQGASPQPPPTSAP